MVPLLDKKAVAAINEPDSVKVLSTISRAGEPHVVYKGSLSAADDGHIRYFELNETSQTNKNLTYSLWFKKLVAINVLAKDRASYQIKGIPVKAIICGREFESAYIDVRKRLGKDADLSTIWIIEPISVQEETFYVRQREEREKYPLIGHLDRFTVHK
jgi:hypothetical protein